MAKLKTASVGLRVADWRTVKVEPKRADPELLTREHREWREAVLRRAGYRCEVVEDGARCERAAPRHRMFADHINERRDGGDPLDVSNGQCLCGKHHSLKTARRRSARLADGAR